MAVVLILVAVSLVWLERKLDRTYPVPQRESLPAVGPMTPRFHHGRP